MKAPGDLCDRCTKPTGGHTYLDPDGRELCPRCALVLASDQIMKYGVVSIHPKYAAAIPAQVALREVMAA